MLPQAIQELSRTDKVVRWARCPEHNKRSSAFRGVQPDLFSENNYWVFQCSEKGRHLFRADPDRTAPAVGGEAEWLRKKLQERLQKLGLA